MPGQVQDIAAGIRSKVSVILDRQEMLRQQIAAGRAEAAGLRKRVEELSTEVARLKADNEYLRVMRIVASTPEQVERSRAMLTGLVREIDRCIAELKAC